MYHNLDINSLFKEGDSNYSFDPILDDRIERVENKLGYHFPNSFKEFLIIKNGGEIKNYECWLTGIYGIAKEENDPHSLENQYRFWIEEWEYPKTAVPFGDTQSAGHDLYCFDYNNLNENGEPKVVLIDNEMDNSVRVIADNFVDFIEMVYQGKNITEGLNEAKSECKVIDTKPYIPKNKEVDTSLKAKNNNKLTFVGLMIFGIICIVTGVLVFYSHFIGSIFMTVFGIFCILISVLALINKKR